MLRHGVGQLVRRVAPRSVAALEEVAALREQIADLRHQLDQARAECAELKAAAAAEDEAIRGDVGRLGGRLDQFDADLTEARRLSLRVAQLTDLVFDRLADLPGGLPERPGSDRTPG